MFWYFLVSLSLSPSLSFPLLFCLSLKMCVCCCFSSLSPSPSSLSCSISLSLPPSPGSSLLLSLLVHGQESDASFRIDYLAFSVLRWKGNADMSDDDEEGEGVNAPAQSKKKKNKKQKKKKRAAQPAKKNKNVEPAKAESLGPYKPGNFSQERIRFMNEAKKEGHTHKVANDMWMASDLRASLLADMPWKEQVRRKFVPPAKPRNKK